MYKDELKTGAGALVIFIVLVALQFWLDWNTSPFSYLFGMVALIIGGSGVKGWLERDRKPFTPTEAVIVATTPWRWSTSLIFYAGLALAACVMLFPPWHYWINTASVRRTKPAMRDFIFMPPEQLNGWSLGIDFGRLAVEVGGIALLTATGLVVRRGKMKGDKAGPHVRGDLQAANVHEAFPRPSGTIPETPRRRYQSMTRFANPMDASEANLEQLRPNPVTEAESLDGEQDAARSMEPLMANPPEAEKPALTEDLRERFQRGMAMRGIK